MWRLSCPPVCVGGGYGEVLAVYYGGRLVRKRYTHPSSFFARRPPPLAPPQALSCIDGEMRKSGEPGVTALEREFFLRHVGTRVPGSEPLPGSLLSSM